MLWLSTNGGLKTLLAGLQGLEHPPNTNTYTKDMNARIKVLLRWNTHFICVAQVYSTTATTRPRTPLIAVRCDGIVQAGRTQEHPTHVAWGFQFVRGVWGPDSNAR